METIRDISVMTEIEEPLRLVTEEDKERILN